ncbi:MAG: (d)CMP kinase [Propionibacteriaceae bacterium]|jgi:cytidylate kinase|nr:(d)CMP kinase [Propionibacteriaceae bacterium]
MFTVAIDGPSGSGKSTAARRCAQLLSAHYLDTGAMYRAAAAACIAANVDPNDAKVVERFIEEMDLVISTDPAPPRVRVNGVDVSDQIRRPEVAIWTKALSTDPLCRANMVVRQQAIIADGNFVVEGRDITTVVAPKAQVRVLLTADEAVRMARRGAEQGTESASDNLVAQIADRDRADSTLVNFTVAADGVVTIDSTDLTIDQVVAAIMDLAHQAGLAR